MVIDHVHVLLISHMLKGLFTEYDTKPLGFVADLFTSVYLPHVVQLKYIFLIYIK